MYSRQTNYILLIIMAALCLIAAPSVSYAKLPSTIAVLPVSGDGQPEDLKELRVTFFNHIASKNYADTELASVDSKIFLEEQKTGRQWQDFTTKELGDLLGADGLVYVKVLGVDKIYAGIYGSLTVSLAVKLVDADTGAVIWEKEDSVVKQSGSIPLSPWAAISTAVSSALVLRDSVKIGLFDELCRGIAKQMPEPVDLLKLRPPTIYSVVTNALDSPFKTGSEILVSLKGDEGLDAYFDIGTQRKGVEMQETAPGQYLGKYVVVQGDGWENQLITVYLNNSIKRKSAKSQVPYQITADTTPPAVPADFSSGISEKGLKLTWAQVADADIKEYVIQKATLGQAEYVELTHTPLAEYDDADIKYGQKVFYRLMAKDAAGNLSRYTETSRMMVKPGPTEVSGELRENTIFYSIASPYIIKGNLKVPKGIQLEIEDGAVLKFEDGAALTVEGTLKAAGTERQNIVFKGKDYKINFTDTGIGGGTFGYTLFQGGDVFNITNSGVTFDDCRMEGFAQGLKLQTGADVSADEMKFISNGHAVDVIAGKFSCLNCEFSENTTAITVKDGYVTIKDIALQDNGLNISSEKPLNIVSALMNDRPSFEIIRSFKGQVSVDNIRPFGKSLENLRDDSSNDLAVQISENLTDEKYEEADKLLSTMKDLFPARYETVKTIHGFVKYKAGQQPEGTALMNSAKTSYSGALASVLNPPAGAKASVVRFIRIRIPVIGSGEGIDKLAAAKAGRQAIKLFTDEKTGPLDRERSFVVNEKILSASESYTENSYQLFSGINRGFFDGLYLVQFKGDKVVNDLTELGIIGGKGRKIKIAVVSCGSDDNILPSLVNSLTAMKFIVNQLSGKGCSVADYRDEARQSSDVLVIIKEQYSVSESRVSKNLKMINADLGINMFDLKTGAQLYDSSKGSVVYHMNQTMGKKSAISSCYDLIKNELMNKAAETDRNYK